MSKPKDKISYLKETVRYSDNPSAEPSRISKIERSIEAKSIKRKRKRKARKVRLWDSFGDRKAPGARNNTRLWS